MLSASTLSFTGPAYSQNFDGLPIAGADQATISKFKSSGPFDAISPTSGKTVDTGNNPQGLGDWTWPDGPLLSTPATT